MADRTVVVRLQGDASGLVQAANQARSALGGLADTNVGQVGERIRGVGSAASQMSTESDSAFSRFKSSIAANFAVGQLAANAMTNALGSIGGAITQMISVGADYQTTLFTFGAITKKAGDTAETTASQLSMVSAKARELGKDMSLPGTSANDAALAMTELAKGGFSVADSMTAAKGTLQLAAAASVSAAQAAEIQVNAMNAYHLSADQASTVADQLANVANAASGSMTDFAYGLTAAGATAHSFGISLGDTNTTLGLFANAGIKGEEGGTLLKTMLTHLAAPTKPAAQAIKELGLNVYDAAGNFVGMSSVTDQLRSAHDRLTMAAFNTNTAIVFGTRGIKGAAILGAEAAGAFDSMSTAVNRQGGAADVAAAKMQGFNGALQNFQNQYQDVQLAVFDKVGPELTTLVTVFAGAVPVMADAALSALSLIGDKVVVFFTPIIDAAKQLADQGGPAVTGFFTIIRDGVTTALDAIAPFGAKVAELFTALGNSGVADAVGLAFVALGKAFTGVTDAIGPVLAVVGKVIDIFTSMPGPLQTAGFAFAAMLLFGGPITAFFDSILAGATTAAFAVAQAAVSIKLSTGSMAAVMDVAATAGKGLWASIGGGLGLVLVGVTTAISFFAGQSKEAAVATTDFSDAIDASTGRIKDNAVQLEAQKLAQSGSISLYQQAGGAAADYAAGLLKGGDAANQVKGQLIDSGIAAVTASGQYDGLATAAGVMGVSVRDYVAAGLSATSGSLHDLTVKDMPAAAASWAQFTADTNSLSGSQQVAAQAIAAAGTSATDSTAPVAALSAAQAQLNTDAAAAADPINGMKESLTAMKTAADGATTASDWLWASLQQLSKNALTAEQATRLNEAAFRAIAQAAQDLTDKQTAAAAATNDGGKAARSAADAGDTLANAQVKAAQSAADMAAAAYNSKVQQGDMAGATAAATSVMEGQRQKFIESQSAADQESGAAAALADHLGLIPANVKTVIDAQNLAGSLQSVIQLNAQLDSMNNKQIRYSVIENQVVQHTVANAGGASTTDIYAAPGSAEGGWVSGPGGPKDDKVPARLSPGEFVVNAAQASKYGALLTAVNGGVLGFAAGGSVPAVPASAAPAAATVATAGGGSVDPAAVAAASLPDPAVYQAAWNAISAAVSTAWTATIKPTFEALTVSADTAGADQVTLGATINGTWVGAVEPTFAAMNQGEAGVAAANQALLNETINPVWSQIGAGINGTWSGMIWPTYGAWNNGTWGVRVAQDAMLNETINPVWSQLGATINGTWTGTIWPTYGAWNNGTWDVRVAQDSLLNQTINPVWSQIGATISNTWVGTIAPTYAAMNQGVTDVGTTIQGVYDSHIVPMWQGVQGFASATGSFFSGISAGLGSATSEATSDITQITAAVNGFFDLVNSKAPAGAAAPAPAAPGLADGGMITAGTGPRADDVHIRASKGEYVVNAAATAKNRAALDQINFGGSYADGGAVGDKISTDVHDKVVAGTQRAIQAGVNKVLASVSAGGAGYVFNGQLSVGGDTIPLPTGPRGEFLKNVASKMGTSYVWGAAGPDVFDCSGLMSWALNQAGVNVGRLTAEGFNSGFAHLSSAQVGDLVTFDTGRIPGQAGHIGAILDVAKGLMMNTDGAGPAGVANYTSRDGGPLSIIDPIGGTFQASPSTGSGAAGDPPSGGWLASVLASIKSGGTAAAAGGQPGANTSGTEQWRGLVDQALTILGQPVGLDNLVLNQMRTESGGNQAAINLTDSNAQRGTPSKGLVQVIDPTFKSFAVAPYNQNIWDPLSNILAGVNYAIHQYGSIQAGMRGVAYDNGGSLPPGFTMAYNGTGQDEWVGKTQQVASQPMNFAPVFNQRFFIGSQEITGIVRSEIDQSFLVGAYVAQEMAGQSR